MKTTNLRSGQIRNILLQSFSQLILCCTFFTWRIRHSIDFFLRHSLRPILWSYRIMEKNQSQFTEHRHDNLYALKFHLRKTATEEPPSSHGAGFWRSKCICTALAQLEEGRWGWAESKPDDNEAPRLLSFHIRLSRAIATIPEWLPLTKGQTGLVFHGWSRNPVCLLLCRRWHVLLLSAPFTTQQQVGW